MRSTAFTSVMLALALPGAASAEGPGPGCYARDYGAEHLASHPEQVVARMSLRVLAPNEIGEAPAELRVVLSDQGRARAEGMGGQALRQALACTDRSGSLICGVECDGGLFAAAEDAEGLTLTTDRLLLGDAEECGGRFDIVEREGEPVTYRLPRVDASACEES